MVRKLARGCEPCQERKKERLRGRGGGEWRDICVEGVKRKGEVKGIELSLLKFNEA